VGDVVGRVVRRVVGRVVGRGPGEGEVFFAVVFLPFAAAGFFVWFFRFAAIVSTSLVVCARRWAAGPTDVACLDLEISRH
jgi:hypothetical protein